MLEEIRLDGLGVIAAAAVPLHPGFTVLTGETGAGKTMLLSALDLLFGGRADSALVRPGAARARVEGRLHLATASPGTARALQAGAELDEDGSLLVQRTIGTEGRSRALLGGTSVPNGVLTEIAARVVAVHGQADQHRLTAGSRQREVLDRYAGAAASEALAAYQVVYTRRQEVADELAELVRTGPDTGAEIERLRYATERVAVLAPDPDEDDELAERIGRLSHADALVQAASVAYAAMGGEESDSSTAGGYASLAAAAHALAAVAGHDPVLADLSARAEELLILAADLQGDLAGYREQVAADPAALARAQERVAALADAGRAYCPQDPTAAGLVAWSRGAAARLAALEGAEARQGALRETVRQLDRDVAERAAALHDVRAAAASRLAEQVRRELAGLAMPTARLTVQVAEAAPGMHGADEVAILFAAHDGTAERPLARAASGGELSRVMLALEVVLAGADPVPTMVFDEVDAGVGGEAAVEIGVRLARLARHHQVLVVTHLPQVAAFADLHVRVRKDAGGDVTASDVTVLDEDERVVELARMLGGLAGSESAQEHARELLARAAPERAPGTTVARR